MWPSALIVMPVSILGTDVTTLSLTLFQEVATVSVLKSCENSQRLWQRKSKAVLSDLRNMINTDNTIKKHRCLKAYVNTGKACWEQVVKVIVDYPFYNARHAMKTDNMHVVCRLL